MSAALAGMTGYVLVQFAIGVYVSRRMTSASDYILAGRSLGTGLVAFSVFATWFGAEAIVASAGEIYGAGLSGALTDPLSYGVAVIVVGALIAARVWGEGVTTFADVFARRFSPEAEKLFVLLLVPGSVFWAAAQIRAFGTILSSGAAMSLTTAIILAALLVGAYSVVGGLLADAVTDVIQGLAVIFGLLVLVGAVLVHFGGLGAALAAVEPERLALLGGAKSMAEKIESVAVALCGSIVAVEIVSRLLGARSAEVARRGTIIGGVMYLVLGLAPVLIGLVGPKLVPGLEAQDQIVARVAERLLPTFGFALFAGALISAILSVVHAALHAPAAQISHNLVGKTSSPEAGLWRVRLTVLALSLVAFVLALSVSRIKELVEIASAFGSAGVLVAALFGLFTRLGGPRSAIAAMLTGLGAWAIGRFVLGTTMPYVTAIALSTVVYVAVALAERRTQAA
jgi:Na+/proline symporter